MLTDDDLTHELGAAFRDRTDTLHYRGRRRPRPILVTVAPTAAVGVGLATVAVAAAVNAGSGPAPTTGATSATSATPTAAGTPVTEEIQLAGYTLTYTRSSTTEPLHARSGVTVPEDAVEVPLSGTDAQAWSGQDAETGADAIFVQAPTRNGGKVFELTGAGWTAAQLVDLLKHGSTRAVPLVEE